MYEYIHFSIIDNTSLIHICTCHYVIHVVVLVLDLGVSHTMYNTTNIDTALSSDQKGGHSSVFLADQKIIE
jgi:hypothetical protein